MTDKERAAYARDLTGHETSTGFLVLTPSAPLTLSPADVPDLRFGGATGGPTVDILRRACPKGATTIQANPAFKLISSSASKGTWICSATLPFTVAVSGRAAFQHSLVNSIGLAE